LTANLLSTREQYTFRIYSNRFEQSPKPPPPSPPPPDLFFGKPPPPKKNSA
jgi:hypothetical protein